MSNQNKILNAVTVGGAILVVLFIIGIVMVLRGNTQKSSKTEEVSSNTYQSAETQNSDASPAKAAPEQKAEASVPPPALSRIVTYSPNYTYKRMSDIHSSIEATDTEMRQMSDLIQSFNNSWILYINTGDRSVFSYLREGTEAYNNAVKYSSKNISESYETMDIRDARKAGNEFYVWDYEVINEYSDTTKRKEYHWVYRISKDSGGYYIADYTSDPAYN